MKKLLFFSIILSFLLINSNPALAANPVCEADARQGDLCGGKLDGSLQCLPEQVGLDTKLTCQSSAVGKAFGQIKPPPPLLGLLQKDTTGAGAISTFLSNGINLIYIIAAIVLLFMIIWGAFQWLTSGGDKEQVAAAQRRILNAIIGILLFAAAFAIISVIGAFTGFKFFEGQDYTVIRRYQDGSVHVICNNGKEIYVTSTPDAACQANP